MGEHAKEFTNANFDAAIKKGNVVVDFWAEWCGPCKIMSPVVEVVAQDMKGKVTFGKVNVDKEYELAGRFDVMSIPTLIFFKNGEAVGSITGAVPKDVLLKKIKEVF